MEQSIVVAGTIMLTVVGAVWSLALWLTKQFSQLRSLLYEKIEQTLDKLEYHEKHDDKRFSELTNQLWEIRLKQAIEGKILGKEAKNRTIEGSTRPSGTC